MRNNGQLKNSNSNRRKERDILLVINADCVIINTLKNYLIDINDEDYIKAERDYQRVYKQFTKINIQGDNILELTDNLKVIYANDYRAYKKNKK